MNEVEKLPMRVTAIEVKIDNLREDQHDLRDSFKGLRNALIIFALSIAGSAVTFGFAVLQLTK